MDDKKQALLARYVTSLLNSGALLVRTEPIKLRSGGLSHIYFNHNAMLSKPEHLVLLLDVFIYLLQDKRDIRLGVVDSVMSPILGGLLTTRLSAPVIVTKQKEIAHGVETQVFGEVKGNVVLVDDMTSTGGLLIKTADVLRSKGCSVDLACLCITRSEEAVQALSQHGIQLRQLTTFKEVLLLAWPKLTKEQRELVLTEMAELRKAC